MLYKHRSFLCKSVARFQAGECCTCAFFAGEDFPRSESMGFNRLLSQVVSKPFSFTPFWVRYPVWLVQNQMDRINQVVAGCGNHHFTSQLIFSELKESMVMDDMLQCFPPKNAYRLKHLPTSSSSTKTEPSVEDLLRGITFQVHELGHGGVLQVLSQQGRGWMRHKGGKDLGGELKSSKVSY